MGAGGRRLEAPGAGRRRTGRAVEARRRRAVGVGWAGAACGVGRGGGWPGVGGWGRGLALGWLPPGLTRVTE